MFWTVVESQCCYSSENECCSQDMKSAEHGLFQRDGECARAACQVCKCALILRCELYVCTMPQETSGARIASIDSFPAVAKWGRIFIELCLLLFQSI